VVSMSAGEAGSPPRAYLWLTLGFGGIPAVPSPWRAPAALDSGHAGHLKRVVGDKLQSDESARWGGDVPLKVRAAHDKTAAALRSGAVIGAPRRYCAGWASLPIPHRDG
jgi:hypothetical protein